MTEAPRLKFALPMSKPEGLRPSASILACALPLILMSKPEGLHHTASIDVKTGGLRPSASIVACALPLMLSIMDERLRARLSESHYRYPWTG